MFFILLHIIPFIGVFSTISYMATMIVLKVVFPLIFSCLELSEILNIFNFHFDYMKMGGDSSVSASKSIFDLLPNTGIHLIDERIVFTNGVASPEDANIRNSTINNGYNPNVSHQPYAGNLAKMLKDLRNGGSSLPDELVDADANFLRAMARHCWNNYDPNKHYLNSRTMRSFIKNLF